MCTHIPGVDVVMMTTTSSCGLWKNRPHFHHACWMVKVVVRGVGIVVYHPLDHGRRNRVW